MLIKMVVFFTKFSLFFLFQIYIFLLDKTYCLFTTIVFRKSFIKLVLWLKLQLILFIISCDNNINSFDSLNDFKKDLKSLHNYEN